MLILKIKVKRNGAYEFDYYGTYTRVEALVLREVITKRILPRLEEFLEEDMKPDEEDLFIEIQRDNDNEV